MPVHVLECNPFQENTFVVTDASGKVALLIDCGCYDGREQDMLRLHLNNLNLIPSRYLLTHAHIDHIFGNRWVYDTWGLKPELNQNELAVLHAGPAVAAQYGLRYQPGPEHRSPFLKEDDVIDFGESQLRIIETPGHSPGGICFYNEEEGYVIAGDALFRLSIGRTDLPGGNHQQLLRSIRTKLFVLPDDTRVYSGHGPTTTIGFEKLHNPFLQND